MKKLDAAITAKFIELFTESNLTAEFTHWHQRFTLTAVAVEVIIKEKVSWSITFEDHQDSFAHFNLYIKDNKVIDLSIDT
ncbi:hypothetical protein FLA_0889 [Filimonas lacunae]|nr:hypothetical protein FLA_0889 [Filimonas lacunae]